MKTHYPTQRGAMYRIDDMSKGYLKTEIAYIERTGNNIEYLPELKARLRKKSLIKFTNISNL